MKLFFLFSLSTVLQAAEVTIINECDKPIFFSVAAFQGGGTDGIGDGGSWGSRFSKGWYRIGPFQRETARGSFFRVEVDAVGVTLEVPRNAEDNRNVESFCTHPQEGFEYNFFYSDNTGQNRARVHHLERCLREKRAKWRAYQRINPNWGTYTIFQSACNPQRPVPAALGTIYKQDPGQQTSMAFYKSKPATSEVNVPWYVMGAENNQFVQQVYQTGVQSGYTIVKEQLERPYKYAFTEGRFKVMRFGDSEWQDRGTGRWID